MKNIIIILGFLLIPLINKSQVILYSNTANIISWNNSTEEWDITETMYINAFIEFKNNYKILIITDEVYTYQFLTKLHLTTDKKYLQGNIINKRGIEYYFNYDLTANIILIIETNANTGVLYNIINKR